MALSFLKRTGTGTVIRTLLVLLLLLPVWMYIAWLCAPKRELVIAIIDKTVLNTKDQEHVSLNWVLDQEKFTKDGRQLYKSGKDYYGFFPLEGKRYELHGLEEFSTERLDRLAVDADVMYITDAYGIFRNEWLKEGDAKERSGIVYGGLSQQDFYLLKQMRDKKKLLITEFNCLASPTPPAVRAEFENLFGVRWTGWIGRFFSSFDTTVNKELPKWLISNYKQQHNGAWPFSKPGIAFIHSDDTVVILEEGSGLETTVPYIYSTADARKKYGLPEKIPYSFWFDIVQPDPRVNKILSSYQIETTAKGKEELNRHGLPASFPAVTAHIADDYRFYYFSGDFADAPVSVFSSHFKGIGAFKRFMFNPHDEQDRRGFFWSFYRPLVTSVLNDYYSKIKPD
ncbi:hypothetical protein [Sediminibacterium ginsengisoli]|uniref:Uncharacterized protein n=1 Tax=Sediminibacterium ginsengisoli TaxID=413434 RepID=A0A1T4RS80_9BACT|nr:hypothetical protein [Sediminibacterium ginsengisoli]SKA18628.1 hypothetical protein SAMN04488132_11430 [Sediminibacterium ginsengisoli]